MTTSVRLDRLETERLIMRRWQESDRAPFAELNADPDTMRFFPNTLDRAASNGLIEIIETRFDRQGFGFWALEVAATDTFIGFTGLNPLPDGGPGAGGIGGRLAGADGDDPVRPPPDPAGRSAPAAGRLPRHPPGQGLTPRGAETGRLPRHPPGQGLTPRGAETRCAGVPVGDTMPACRPSPTSRLSG